MKQISSKLLYYTISNSSEVILNSKTHSALLLLGNQIFQENTLTSVIHFDQTKTNVGIGFCGLANQEFTKNTLALFNFLKLTFPESQIRNATENRKQQNSKLRDLRSFDKCFELFKKKFGKKPSITKNIKTKEASFLNKRRLQKSFRSSGQNFEKNSLLSRMEAQSSEIFELKKQVSDLQETFNLAQEKKSRKSTKNEGQKSFEDQNTFIPETKNPFFNVNENLTEAKFAELVLTAVKKTLEPHLLFLQKIEETFLSKQVILDDFIGWKPSMELLKTKVDAFQTRFQAFEKRFEGFVPKTNLIKSHFDYLTEHAHSLEKKMDHAYEKFSYFPGKFSILENRVQHAVDTAHNGDSWVVPLNHVKTNLVKLEMKVSNLESYKFLG